MPSLLARLGTAAGQVAIPAAEARAGYLSGEREEKLTQNAQQRQSMLDRMQQMLGASQIDETKARGDYYKGLSTDNWAENAQGDIFNKRTGEVHRGTGKPPVAHGEEHFDPTKGEVDPTTGKPTGEVGLTFVGPDGQVSWRKTRDATMIDRVKYSREPRDPNSPAPEQPDVAEDRKYTQKKRAADDLVSGFLASHDVSELTADKLQIYAGHVLTPEERSALGRMRTPPAGERSMDMPQITPPGSPKIITTPGATGTPGAAPAAGTRKPAAKPPIVPSTSFETAGSYAKRARGENPDQDEIDKAALRQAHPEMNEDQVSSLLGQLRGTRPPE